MAQAQGGTAGSSVGRGNGSMSANGGRSQSSQNAGKNDSRGPGGSLSALAGNSTTSSGNKSTNTASATKSTPSVSTSKTTGGIMSGLTGAVTAARAARTSSPAATSSISSNIGNAVNSAFSGKDQSTGSFGAGVSDNGSVSNSVGAMNTPQAKAKAESQMNAFKSGYRDQANNSMTGAAFGTAGTVGSAVGAGIGKITGANYAAGSDEANTAARGAAYANQNGLSSTARGLGSMAAGILGGPVGSAIASLALGGTSYAMQRNAFPSAFDGQQDKGITSGMAMNNGSETMREGGLSSGNNMASSMQQAAVPQQVTPEETAAVTPAPFEHANDYTNQRNSLWGMNLGSII